MFYLISCWINQNACTHLPFKSREEAQAPLHFATSRVIFMFFSCFYNNFPICTENRYMLIPYERFAFSFIEKSRPLGRQPFQKCLKWRAYQACRLFLGELSAPAQKLKKKMKANCSSHNSLSLNRRLRTLYRTLETFSPDCDSASDI